ncbi:MAG: hypothetical protein H0T46_12530 [Deltaproteobacteria bacterium]|nr:hypothetical protein [Deltaproteobacteria bacterium]
MQILASFSGVHRVALLVALAAGIVLYRLWPAPPPEPVTSPSVPAIQTVRAVDPAVLAFAGGCVPFVDALTAKRTWSLSVSRRAFNQCSGGDTILDSYEVYSTGAVVWTERGVATRTLQLTPGELAVIVNANRIDCASGPESESSTVWMTLGDTRIPMRTLLGVALDGVFKQAISRYTDVRLAALGTFELRLSAKRDGHTYRLHLGPAGMLTVRRGNRLLATHELIDHERLALLDHTLARVALPQRVDPDADPDEEDFSEQPMRGTLDLGEVVVPAMIEYTFDAWTDVLWRAVREAEDAAAER